MKWFLILLIAISTGKTALGQSFEDSIMNIINTSKQPKDKKEATFKLGEYLVQRNPEQAEIYANELLNSANFPKDSSEWARLNYIFAASHRWQGNYKTALEYYQSNYDYFKRLNNKKEIAVSAHFLGSIHLFSGNNTIAQSYLLEAATIYEAIGTKLEKANINKTLASFYMNIEQEEKGLERYVKALEDFTSINDSAGMASCYANLGKLYIDLGDFEKAEAHLLMQKALNEVFPTQREMGFHYDFMGLLRQKQGKLNEAYEAHLTALKIREQLSSTFNLCESKLNISEVLIQLGKHSEAIKHLLDVLSYEEHDSKNQASTAHYLLSEAYEKTGNFAEALNHYKQYKSISDSIYNEESIQIIAEKDAQFLKQEQDAEIALLSKENARSKILLYGSLILVLLFLIFSIAALLMYQKIKNQNNIIQKTLSEKDLLIHEIHHRVKNNLQIISSLLKLQSRYIKDKTALAAIEDGRNRVQSMAILHKNLYKDENTTGVNMQVYFADLIDGIFQSYSLDKGKIALDLEIDSVEIDIDTVISIGLIMNELITNAIKYAFDDGQPSPTIQVKFKNQADDYELIVRDNGIGIKDEIINATTTETFGQKMIQTFVQKLKARMQINNKNGTEVTILIPKASKIMG
jgi:two-component sensor histidine kinase/Flp pilus assembly protein TadD